MGSDISKIPIKQLPFVPQFRIWTFVTLHDAVKVVLNKTEQYGFFQYLSAMKFSTFLTLSKLLPIVKGIKYLKKKCLWKYEGSGPRNCRLKGHDFPVHSEEIQKLGT